MKHLKIIAFSLFAACSLSVLGAYPGNPNFRNVSVIKTASTRTDWVTNILDNALSYSFDWSKGQQLSPGVTFVPSILTTEAGWPRKMVCYFVRIDLTTPGLRFTGADRCPEGWGDPMPEPEAKCKNYPSGYYPKRTVREKTSDFLARNRGPKSKGGKARNAVLAWNGAAWLPWTNPTTNLWACPYSPLYSDGIQISNNRTGGVEVPNLKDPAPQAMFVQLKNNTCGIIGSMTEDFAKMTWFCLPAFVTGLVAGNWANLDNGDIAQRTAIGQSQDGKTFYLFVCDGRDDNWTKGCDFTSLSKLLYGMGAWQAFNLDGGGSATLCRWNDDLGKIEVLNRQGGLRDNGSNVAIYYMEPQAILGGYFYEDFDFMIQDIIDGESPAMMTEVDVVGDATFTAEHPCIPVTGFTLCSTNNSSVGWEDGVTPEVPAGKALTFRNIRLRTDTLYVAAGGKAVLNGATGFTEVSTADATGIAIAGTVPTGLRVRCAAATNVGDCFGTSTLPIAQARTEARKIVCADNSSLVADAVEDGGVIKLKWSKIVTFGQHSGKLVELGRGVVNVTVDDCNSDYSTGYKLKFTVKSEDGLRSATKTVDFAGPGDYAFDTADTSAPTICGVGYGFDYTVELVDASGTRVLNSEVASGSMGLGVSNDWFNARAADDSAEGGAWTTKPSIENGRYAVSEGANLDFAANEAKDGRVRFETVLEFNGFITDACAQQMLDGVRTSYSAPHGACFVAQGADGSPVWHGLVSENGEPAFKTLYGPAALNTPTKVFCDVDWSSGTARVRYSIAVGGGAETVLADEAGNSWFAGASSSNTASGRVMAVGSGSVSSLIGTWLKRDLVRLEVSGTTSDGVVYSVGIPYVWIEEYGLAAPGSDMAAHAAAVAPTADADSDGIPNWAEYLCGTSPVDANDKLVAHIAVEDGGPVVTYTPEGAPINGFKAVVKGTDDLSAAPSDWATVPDSKTSGYHFFRIEVVPK